jgi:hypothetical protein
MSKSYKELRDWYAGLAMQAFISADDSRDWNSVAEEAFQQAAVMMRQRLEEDSNDGKC